MTYLKFAEKVENIWATLKRKFVDKNFLKLPNLVTLPRVQLGVYAKLKGLFKLLQNFDFVVSLRLKTFHIKVLQMQQ